MKIRTDFVTNSSSSSFTLMIRFDLTDGSCVQFDAQGGTGESGRIDYFADDAIVKVSPKQLGTAKNVNALVELLAKGVVDGWDENPIFDKSRPVQSDVWSEYDEDDDECDECDEDMDGGMFDAYDFIVEIREKIKSMDQIAKVTISGDEENYESYNRTYTYDRITGKYTGKEEGCEFEKDGSSGGDLQFKDLHTCKIEHINNNE